MFLRVPGEIAVASDTRPENTERHENCESNKSAQQNSTELIIETAIAAELVESPSAWPEGQCSRKHPQQAACDECEPSRLAHLLLEQANTRDRSEQPVEPPERPKSTYVDENPGMSDAPNERCQRRRLGSESPGDQK